MSNPRVHILLIEDDKKIVSFLSMALTAKGYRLTAVSTGNEGALTFCTEIPDIVLLDLGLPDREGTSLITEIRKVSKTPILVISARDQEEDKIAALDAGANDYVTKPFSMGELLARIRVLERFVERETITAPARVFRCDGLVVDMDRRRVFADEKEVHLTPLEYKLLVYLIANRGKVVLHSQLMKDVWGYEATGDLKSIRVYMTSLRRKIERDSAAPRFILTEIGVGYRFSD